MTTSKKKLENWCENGSKDREPKCSHYHEVRGKYEREASKAKKCVAVLRNDRILPFGEVFETLLTSSNSFNISLPSSHCLHFVANGRLPIARATSTNSNAHVSVQRVLRCTCEAYTRTPAHTPSLRIWWRFHTNLYSTRIVRAFKIGVINYIRAFHNC